MGLHKQAFIVEARLLRATGVKGGQGAGLQFGPPLNMLTLSQLLPPQTLLDTSNCMHLANYAHGYPTGGRRPVC